MKKLIIWETIATIFAIITFWITLKTEPDVITAINSAIWYMFVVAGTLALISFLMDTFTGVLTFIIAILGITAIIIFIPADVNPFTIADKPIMVFSIIIAFVITFSLTTNHLKGLSEIKILFSLIIEMGIITVATLILKYVVV